MIHVVAIPKYNAIHTKSAISVGRPCIELRGHCAGIRPADLWQFVATALHLFIPKEIVVWTGPRAWHYSVALQPNNIIAIVNELWSAIRDRAMVFTVHWHHGGGCYELWRFCDISSLFIHCLVVYFTPCLLSYPGIMTWIGDLDFNS